jgi:hypothetical protein
VNFVDADSLAGKDRAEVNLFAPQADPAAIGDDNRTSLFPSEPISSDGTSTAGTMIGVCGEFKALLASIC